MMHMGGVQTAPWSMNTMYVLDDFTAENGGTLVVRTLSHSPVTLSCSPITLSRSPVTLSRMRGLGGIVALHCRDPLYAREWEHADRAQHPFSSVHVGRAWRWLTGCMPILVADLVVCRSWWLTWLCAGLGG
jgi:hypothetical protein